MVPTPQRREGVTGQRRVRSAGRRRWTSFVADQLSPGRVVRGLHEEANPSHRLRVEHDSHTLLIHLSDEEGGPPLSLIERRAGGQ